MKEHQLKIKQEYLEAIKSGKKTWEIRYNDRNYHEGDVLVFPDGSKYMITYLIPLDSIGLPNFVGMTIGKVIGK